jgi:hypothetical protein
LRHPASQGPKAQFAITPGKAWHSYPQEDVHRLVGLVGAAQASRLLFSAQRIDGAEAERIGLVERFFAENAAEEAEAYAAAVAANDPASLRTLKRAVRLAERGIASDAGAGPHVRRSSRQRHAVRAARGASDAAPLKGMLAWLVRLPQGRAMTVRLSIMSLLLLAACSDAGKATEEALAASEEKAADSGRIACAVGGAASMARDCTMERLSGPEGTTLTVRHSSGAFRRLLVTTDGRGVVAADGADPAVVSVIGDDRIEVSIAGDRYQLPATVKARP